MADGLDERGRALEDGYFRQQDNELIAKMRAKIGGEQRGVRCPKCDGHLQSGNFENVQIDICDKCGGVWLDAGELQQVAGKEDDGFFGRLFN